MEKIPSQPGIRITPYKKKRETKKHKYQLRQNQIL